MSRQNNLDNIHKVFVGLKATVSTDRYDSSKDTYDIVSDGRDLHLFVTIPKDYKINPGDPHHERINKFYEKHKRFKDGEFDDSDSTGNLSSMWH